MSELQAEETFEINDDVEGEAASPSEGSDLAPDSGEDREENNSAAQDSVQQAINKQHAKYREEERKRIALEEEKKQLEERLNALESKNEDVSIPPLPDPYDDNYEEKVAQRDAAIMRKAAQDAKKESEQARLDAQRQEAANAEKERIDTLVEGFNKRVTTLGLDEQEVTSAIKTVADYGIQREVAELVLDDEDGPMIVKYLADNPIELDEIRRMSPVKAAMRVHTDIRQKASNLKPQASSAPDPTETFSGRGGVDSTSPLLQGATFE